jgi:hypothetical protein
MDDLDSVAQSDIHCDCLPSFFLFTHTLIARPPSMQSCAWRRADWRALLLEDVFRLGDLTAGRGRKQRFNALEASRCRACRVKHVS